MIDATRYSLSVAGRALQSYSADTVGLIIHGLTPRQDGEPNSAMARQREDRDQVQERMGRAVPAAISVARRMYVLRVRLLRVGH